MKDTEIPIVKRNILNDWYGNKLNLNFSYLLKLQPETITYSTTVSPYKKQIEASNTSFKSGLWLDDVVELFIKPDLDSDLYYEFNFSPAGDWWAASFLSYREIEKELHDINLSIQTALEDQQLSLELVIPNNLINATKDSLFHVSAIFGENNRTFISSSNKPKDCKPDFHNCNFYTQFFKS